MSISISKHSTKNHSLKIAFLLAFPMEVYYMSFTVWTVLEIYFWPLFQICFLSITADWNTSAILSVTLNLQLPTWWRVAYMHAKHTQHSFRLWTYSKQHRKNWDQNNSEQVLNPLGSKVKYQSRTAISKEEQRGQKLTVLPDSSLCLVSTLTVRRHPSCFYADQLSRFYGNTTTSACVCVCWLILTNLPLRPSNPTQSFLLWKALPFEWGDVCLYKLWAKWLLDYILPSVQLKRSSFSLILKLCWIHIFIKYQMIKLLFILLEVYNPESIVTVLNRYAQNEFRTKKKIQARTYLKHWIRNYKHLHRGVQMSAVRSRSVCVVVVVLLRISVPAAQVSYHGAYQLFKGEQKLFSQPALRSYLHFHSVVWVWFMIWALCSTGLQAVQKAPMAHLVCLKSKDYFVLHLKCLWEHSAAFFLIVSNRQSNNSTH